MAWFSRRKVQQQQLSFELTTCVLCSGLGLVYCFAFWSAIGQNAALFDHDGLSPAWPEWQGTYRLGLNKGSAPNLLWILRPSTTLAFDKTLLYVRWTGLCVSILVVLGLHCGLLFCLLWLNYWTIVATSLHSSFYSYGWESQLLETGFLAIFLCHFFPRRRMSAARSQCVLWLYRWLCFRISLGAGLIKLRGSSCWTKKTCLWYHFETQPIPSPLSFYFHFLPRNMLRHGVDLDLAVQLYLSWLVLLPGSNQILCNLRRFGGCLQILFMINIVLSGNFAFLNHLTIIPAIATLDDDFLFIFFRRPVYQDTLYKKKKGDEYISYFRRHAIDIVLIMTIAYLSRPVVNNLLSPHQAMNAAFDPWRIVNSYGAFGDVGKNRFEAIISLYDGNTWYELDFPCKPGNPNRRPCFCAPYHYRLDWNIWFIGFPPHHHFLQQRERWLFTFLQHLLSASGSTRIPKSLSLIDQGSLRRLFLQDNNKAPFFHNAPLAVKVDMYHYKMATDLFTILHHTGHTTAWWNRTYALELIPPVTLSVSHAKGQSELGRLVRWSPPTVEQHATILNTHLATSPQSSKTNQPQRLLRLEQSELRSSTMRV